MPILAINIPSDYESSYDNCSRQNSNKELFSFLEGGMMPKVLEMTKLNDLVLNPTIDLFAVK